MLVGSAELLLGKGSTLPEVVRKVQGGYLELGQGFDEVSASNPPTGGGQGRRSHPSKMGGKGKQIRKTQAEPQWIVAQRLLSALTIPGFS